MFWGSELQVTEKTTDPGDQDPADDQNQQRRTDGVHDSLEMTLILSTSNEGGSTTDERHASTVGDNGIGLSTLATSCVVDNISDVLVDSQGFSSHGRLIDSKKSIAGTVLSSVCIIIIIFLLFAHFVAALVDEFLLVGFVSVRVVISANNSSIGGNDMSIFDNDLLAKMSVM